MTQFNAASYDIERPTGACAFTGRTLEPGEAYVATLVDMSAIDDADASTSQPATDQTPADAPDNAPGDAPTRRVGDGLGLKRLDVAMDVWREGRRPPALFSHWVSTVPQPNQKKKVFVDDAVLMNLLHRLEDEHNRDRLAFRFVLGLVLLRKKLLRYDGSTTEGADDQARTYWLVTPKVDVSKGRMGKWDENSTIRLLDPGLDDAAIEQVTRQLGDILDGDL